jgi:hypothetical protein
MKKFLAIFSFLFLFSGQACAMTRGMGRALAIWQVTDQDAQALLGNGAQAEELERKQFTVSGQDVGAELCHGNLFRPRLSDTKKLKNKRKAQVAEWGHDVGPELCHGNLFRPRLSDTKKLKNKRKAQDQVAEQQDTRSSKAAKQVHPKREMPSLYADAFLNGDIQIRPEYREIDSRPDRVRELRASIDKAQQLEAGIQAREQERQSVLAEQAQIDAVMSEMVTLLKENRLMVKESQDLLTLARICWDENNIQEQEEALASWQQGAYDLEQEIKNGVVYSPEVLSAHQTEVREARAVTKQGIEVAAAQLQAQKKEMAELLNGTVAMMHDVQLLLKLGREEQWSQEWIDQQSAVFDGWINAVQDLTHDVQNGVAYSRDRLFQEQEYLALTRKIQDPLLLRYKALSGAQE